MKGAALERRDSLGHQLRAAFDQPRLLGAVGHRLPRDRVVVVLVRLSEMRGVGEGNAAVLTHPVQGGAGVEPARERDADPLADREFLKYVPHCIIIQYYA